MSRMSILFIASSLVALAMVADGHQIQAGGKQGKKKTGKPGPMAAAQFTLEIQNDSFATFQPINNQFRGSPPPPPQYRHGFLVQVGDFASALHAYTRIELHFVNNNPPPKSYLRGDGPPPWIDVVCGKTTPSPITVDEAKELVPDENDSATERRRLHYDLNYKSPITAITLWSSDDGLQARAETLPSGPSATHGHADYLLSSVKPCEVRVWLREKTGNPPTLGAWKSTPETYPSQSNPSQWVERIVIKEDGQPTPHGGVHNPPWQP